MSQERRQRQVFPPFSSSRILFSIPAHRALSEGTAGMAPSAFARRAFFTSCSSDGYAVRMAYCFLEVLARTQCVASMALSALRSVAVMYGWPLGSMSVYMAVYVSQSFNMVI